MYLNQITEKDHWRENNEFALPDPPTRGREKRSPPLMGGGPKEGGTELLRADGKQPNRFSFLCVSAPLR